MFIDQNKDNSNAYLNDPMKPKKTLAIFFIVLAVVILAGSSGFILYSLKKKPKPKNPIEQIPLTATSTKNKAYLPVIEPGDKDGVNGSSSKSNLRAEGIAFGDFFKVEDMQTGDKIKNYALPINIKTATYNYYEFSRKFDLTPYIDELNANGFAIADNPYRKEANDFFAFNKKMLEKELPLVVTSDFLFYYYENTLKHSYKEIEKTVFYDNLWNLSKAMYDKSSARYRKSLFEKGLSNDPAMEAARMEANFFAVALELLKPKQNQIDDSVTFTDENKFSLQQDVERYSYVLQDFQKEEVNRELAKITEAKKIQRSNILLYDYDYRVFEVPAEYRANARIYNFYLASKWLESLFPLYYKSDLCPACQLDIDDWSVSMAAASMIAADLDEDQQVKNDWANIYKFISFFKGLRQDLTYLQYRNDYQKVFPNLSPDINFSSVNQNRLQDLKAYQTALSDHRFSELQGGYERTPENYPKIGLRLLQEHFWATDYIFKNLVGENYKFNNPTLADRRKSYGCTGPGGDYLYKCRGTAKEALNIVYPVKDDAFNEALNNYSGYQDKVNELRNTINSFSDYMWHTNNYWSNMYLIRSNLGQSRSKYPSFMQSGFWADKELHSSLAIWANQNLPLDTLEPSPTKISGSFAYEEGCNRNNFIEPNFVLIENMIAYTKMLAQMMEATDLARKTNVATINLADLLNDLEYLRSLEYKESRDELFDKKDCDFIRDFVQKYEVKKSGAKSIDLKISPRQVMRQSLDGLKVLLLVNGDKNNKTILAGPLWNYQEVSPK